MRHAAPVRQGLKLRTIFNLLGPLSNPASVKRQVIGVYSPIWLEPIAEVMHRLGAEHVWVVHGHDGLDELSTTGPTQVIELKDGKLRAFEVTPADAGVAQVDLDGLLCGAPEESAASILALLHGETGPFRDIVLLNSAAAFIIAGKAQSLAEGAEMAAASIDEGNAARALDRLLGQGEAMP
jgi:anthranilate phosphoribosyltransferase